MQAESAIPTVVIADLDTYHTLPKSAQQLFAFAKNHDRPLKFSQACQMFDELAKHSCTLEEVKAQKPAAYVLDTDVDFDLDVLDVLELDFDLNFQLWQDFIVALCWWHSYCIRIGAGIWFAAMNYFVHAFMYAHSETTRCRKRATAFATSIAWRMTLCIGNASLMQKCLGLYVVIKEGVHQMLGEERNLHKSNSVLGLSMYFSYFKLFFQLFVENYCWNRQDSSCLPRKPSVSLDIVRKASEICISVAY